MNISLQNSLIDCISVYRKIKLKNKNFRIYDCTSFLDYTKDNKNKPYNVISGINKYNNNHIPNSAYIDIQKHLSDVNSEFKFTILDLKKLAINFQKLGIGHPYEIILYSRNGMQWATRVWWMLKILGFKKVKILNGGYEEWLKLRLPLERKINKFKKANFKYNFNENEIVNKEYILNCISNKNVLLINALTEDIFYGKNDRYGRPGTIPESINLPFNLFLTRNLNSFKLRNKIIEVIKNYNLIKNQEIVLFCGGGIAATLNYFVLYHLGFKNLKLYDNSMSEWTANYNLPIQVKKLS